MCASILQVLTIHTSIRSAHSISHTSTTLNFWSSSLYISLKTCALAQYFLQPLSIHKYLLQALIPREVTLSKVIYAQELQIALHITNYRSARNFSGNHTLQVAITLYKCQSNQTFDVFIFHVNHIRLGTIASLHALQT